MKVADIAPLDIEDADDALLARAEEYPRRPFNDDPHFLAVLEELEETMGFHLISACDESLEVKVGIGGDREVRLRIVDSADADSGGAVPVVRQDSPSATADVAACKAISARRISPPSIPGLDRRARTRHDGPMTGFHARLPYPAHSGVASLEQGPAESGTVRMMRGWEEGEENKVLIDLDCIGNAPGVRIAIPQIYLKKVLNARDVARFDKKEWRREWSEEMRGSDGAVFGWQALEVFQISGSATDRSGRPRNVIRISIRGWKASGAEGDAMDGAGGAESSVWMTAPQFDSLVRSVLRDFGRGNDMTDREIRRMQGEFEDTKDGIMERFEAFLDCLDHDPEKPFPCAWLVREQGERAVEALVKLGVDREDAQGSYVDWSLTDRKFADEECYLHPSNRERIRQERGEPASGIPIGRPLRMRDGPLLRETLS